MYLSGTFGELRSDHFHSGIDIKTESRIGKPVFAIADGHVSRIKISSSGYGKAVYIEHPDGYTSVYGHLWRFTEAVDTYVKQQQYSRRSFEVDLFPPAGKFTFSKGDTIGLSGNTGYSGGPHLHFEIRETASQVPLNPLLMGYHVDDADFPVITLLKIYPYGRNSLIDGRNEPKLIYTQRYKNGMHELNGSEVVEISGDVFFGLNTFDPFNNGKNKNGVYSITYSIDTIPVFIQEFSRIPFHETRYINSLIDYEEQVVYRRGIQKTHIEPGNRLSIYRTARNGGIFTFSDSLLHNINIEVADINGNVSTLSFRVQSVVSELVSLEELADSTAVIFRHDTENHFSDEHISIRIPEDALYDTIIFDYSVKPAKEGALSPTCIIHREIIPLHKYIELGIRPDTMDEGLIPKMLMVREGRKEPLPYTVKWKDGYAVASTRDFGAYYLTADSTAPTVVPLMSDGRQITAGDTLFFKATDDLAGISHYDGFIDDEWALMQYDKKSDLIYFVTDEDLPPGEITLHLAVTDRLGNLKEMEYSFGLLH